MCLRSIRFVSMAATMAKTMWPLFQACVFTSRIATTSLHCTRTWIFKHPPMHCRYMLYTPSTHFRCVPDTFPIQAVTIRLCYHQALLPPGLVTTKPGGKKAWWQRGLVYQNAVDTCIRNGVRAAGSIWHSLAWHGMAWHGMT